MPFLWPEAISQTNQPGGLTANFDSIRTNGVVFTQAYTAGVMCAPARFAVLTGRYCSRSEAARAASNSNNPRVAISVPNCKIDGGDYSKTIPFFMSAAGYQTIFSGKWHLSRGQSAALFADYASVWDDVQASGFTVDGGIYASNMNTLAPGTVDFSHNVEWNVALSRAAIQQAVADGDEFFLYFAPTVPHDSVGASLAITDGILKTPNGTLTTVPASGMPTRANILATYGNLRDSLLGTVLSDLALGAILTELSLHAGVADNTLVIALMDHGVLDKQEITEGGTRIAMMAQYTGMGGLPRGATVSAQVTNLDLASTIFAAAGVSATYANDGASWFATAQGSTPSGRYTISENGQDRAVVSPAGMKLVSRIDAAGASTTALYDLALDPTEIADRSTDSTYATVLSELAAVMQCHDSNTGWTPVADPQPNCHSTSPTTAAPVTAAPTMPVSCCFSPT
jgi:arylsulfatase A-like enzyme